MKRRFYFFVSMFFIISIYLSSEEFVILAVNYNLNIYNQQGVMIKTKKLNFKVEKSILIKKNYAVYDTSDQSILVENLISNKFAKYKFDRIVFKDKTYFEKEIYFNCDYDFKKNELIFCIRPESVLEIDAGGDKAVYSFDKLFDITEIFLYKIDTKELINIEKDGYCFSPRFVNEKVVYGITTDIVMKQKDFSGNYLILEEMHKKGFLKGVTELMLIGVRNGNLIVGAFKNQYRNLLYIFLFDLDKMMIRRQILKNNNQLQNYDFRYCAILDINKHNNRILLSDSKKREIYLVDLKNFKKIFIGYIVAKGTRFINSNEISKWKNVIKIDNNKMKNPFVARQ
ncbi:MAG: hypothetical protein KAS32_20950 [Candidatus Peribacteraceae bacterium]|nr:hypothetical protein [Candidatus Peribacteraceae bacterium]